MTVVLCSIAALCAASHGIETLCAEQVCNSIANREELECCAMQPYG